MDESEPERDEPVIVSLGDLRALAGGETTVGELYDRNPKWGRRTALAAIGGTAGLAFLGGQASGSSHTSGTVGPADEAVLAEISGDIVADGVSVTDLLNVQVYETEADIPDTLDSNVVALHGDGS